MTRVPARMMGVISAGALAAVAVAVAVATAVAAIVSGPALAADPVHSAECAKALDRLQVKEAAMREKPHAEAAPLRPAAPAAPAVAAVPDAAWEKLRRQAAQACLGGPADAPPPAPHHIAPTLIGIAPVASLESPGPLGSEMPGRTLRTPSAPAVPVGAASAVGPPVVMTGCDAAGCMASDGSRADRVGPALLGRRGLCTVQGALLNCP